MADVQAGIGPFLGPLLLAHGWRLSRIGLVMAIGSSVGVAMTTPAGALVDRLHHKRAFVGLLAACTIMASAMVLASQAFAVVAISQVAGAVAGAAVGPTLAGITLGLFHQKGFARQNARNQAFNHAGNMVGAGLSGLLGWKLGLPAVFVLAMGFAVLSVVSVWLIPANAIDHDAARGLGKGEAASGFSTLFQHRALVLLAASLLFFHLGNAAMLPLLGMAASAETDPAVAVSLTIVIAQAVMVVASLIAPRFEAGRGPWAILLVSFLALPIRGFVAAHVRAKWGIYPVQMLDGVGAGLQSVAVPNLVAKMLNGTGRVNVGQGAVMTAQGIGASLSPLAGGILAEKLGYSLAFELLGACALASVALWVIPRSSRSSWA